jgi:hypothetical protein
MPRETMATSSRPDRRAAAAIAYRKARSGRRGTLEERRAAADAEAALARELQDGRYIADDGTEYSARVGGRVRMRAAPEPRESRKARLARRLGIEGDAMARESKWNEIWAGLEDHSPEELESIAERGRLAIDRILAEPDDDDESEEERYG